MPHDTSPNRLTRAAKEIEALDGTHEDKATRFGVAVRTLQRWLSGDTSPRQTDRERVCLAGGPRPETWDEFTPEPAPRAPRLAGPLQPVEPEDVREFASRLYRMALADLEALEGGAEGESEKVRLAGMDRLAGIAVKLGDLTGAVLIDEKRIAASPAWGRLTAKLADALTPYPDAAAAVQAAFEDSIT